LRIDKTFRKKHNINNVRIIEFSLITIGFILSLINTFLLTLFFIGLIFYIKQKNIGNIKALLIITSRSIINNAIGVPISRIGILKWILIFIFATLIFFNLDINKKDKKGLFTFTLLLVLFSLYCVISTLVVSSYPIISIMKILSYAFVFCSVVYGVASTYMKINWIGYLIKFFLIIKY